MVLSSKFGNSKYVKDANNGKWYMYCVLVKSIKYYQVPITSLELWPIDSQHIYLEMMWVTHGSRWTPCSFLVGPLPMVPRLRGSSGKTNPHGFVLSSALSGPYWINPRLLILMMGSTSHKIANNVFTLGDNIRDLIYMALALATMHDSYEEKKHKYKKN